ncbi:uncharacterized protein BXZ73DRAFT_98070 [Epithele typhae]|uniref:uncharacterized protein n=1 Tax=Epithele typhae TaxID=378194 RepID=UPI002008339C|nr:uncharacterized protein BXZ73DRAFT_98070 [Epithele typhae]KAH9941681.1 hypothetical protein BXZ73DRAFT_98070 [Epithele typhae]
MSDATLGFTQYMAIKNRATYNPGINGVNAICDVDFSQFLSFRNVLLLVNVANLALINNIQLSLDFVGALSGTAAVLTCRFILDLFEANTRGRFGTVPTLDLSAAPGAGLSRSLVFRHAGGIGATGAPQGIFGADVSWRSTDESESDWSKKDDFSFELQPMNPERQISETHPLRSEP